MALATHTRESFTAEWPREVLEVGFPTLRAASSAGPGSSASLARRVRGFSRSSPSAAEPGIESHRQLDRALRDRVTSRARRGPGRVRRQPLAQPGRWPRSGGTLSGERARGLWWDNALFVVRAWRLRWPAQWCRAGPRALTVNPSFRSTVTAPVLPPSKSPEARRLPVASS